MERAAIIVTSAALKNVHAGRDWSDKIRRSVPEAVEGIGYRMPGYKLHGKPMLYFASLKEHYSLFAASGTFFAALEDETQGL
jgi:uncharacterized protein YdhG (YjbR/CyaY superfamily)